MRKPLPNSHAIQVVAACSTLFGPCGAWLYESGYIGLFGSAHLLNLWVVVALALAGVAVGAYAASRQSTLLGIGSVVVNAGVAALYGFLGVFFALGGAR